MSMKKMFTSALATGALLLAVGFSAPAMAEDAAAPAAAPAAEAVVVVTETQATAPAAAPAAPAAPEVVLNTGDTAWMLTSTMLVILMTIPGLALFYGGLGRSKNMLSVLMQVFVIFSTITVLWCLYGYSLVFADGGSFGGTFGKLFLNGVKPDTLSGSIPDARG